MLNTMQLLIVLFTKQDSFITNLMKGLNSYLKFDSRFIRAESPKGIRRRGLQKNAQDYLPILEKIRRNEPCDYILGLTADDLFVQDLNFVFGFANEYKNIAIISLFRLQADKEDIHFKRILTESIHELGHLFRIKHCIKPTCVMFFSNSLVDTDHKGYKFCVDCSKKFESKFSYKLW